MRRPEHDEPMPAVLVGGAANALSAARTLWRIGVPVDVLADGVATATVRASRACRHVVDPPVGRPVVEAWLETLLSRCPPSVVLPCSDHGLELVARHRASLVAAGHRPIEAADAVVLALLDKDRTYELARALDVPAPRTATLSERRDLDALDDFLFPCAVKPVHSHVYAHRFRPRAKGALVRDRHEVAEVTGPALDEGIAMLVTEVVEGTDECSSYYTYLTPEGVPLTHFTKVKLRQYPTRFGLGTYHVTRWDEEVAELGLRFFRGVGLHGIGNVEFKRDARDGVLKIIESNPRVTNANELVRASGIDLVRLAYARAVGMPAPALDGFRDGLGMWFPLDDFRALRDYRADGELTTGAWVRSLLRPQVRPELDWTDLGPSLVTLSGRARRWARRGSTRLRGARRTPDAPLAPRVATADTAP
jgi:predicted ATP-grasp superfamily ATP-dependent carboligase